MRQLTFIAPGKLEWHDVPAPRIENARQALVRPIAVARCDLDFYIAAGVVPYPGPFAFGHEMVGLLVEAGDAVDIVPGTKVIVPFQISCGECNRCRMGLTNACEAVPFGAAYGLKPTSGTEFGGALSDLVLVPYADHMLVPLPQGVAPETAANFSDNMADGWRGVAGPLKERPGGSVLVVGGLAQSVGLYAAAAAKALGAGKVLYLDDDAGRRDRATALGVETEPLALADGRTADTKFDIVVEAAGNADALGFAVHSAGANGFVTSVAIHFGETTPVPLKDAYYKGLTFHTSRVHSRAVLPQVAHCVACGRLDAGAVTHRRCSFEEAPDAMTDPGPKVVFLAD